MGYRMPDSASRAMRLNSELNRIVEILKTRGVEKVILFSSLVDGCVGSTSDIDLIIVDNTDRRFLDRLGDIYSAIQPRVATDLLVYTPDELERLVEENSFVRQDVIAVHPDLAPLATIGGPLDKYYIPTRYPNGLAGGIPSDAFVAADAEMATSMAEQVLDTASSKLTQ